MKIYRNNNTGMLALVDPDSTASAIWVHSGTPIYSRLDLEKDWTEQRVVPIDEPEVIEVKTWVGDVVLTGEIALSSSRDA